MIDGQHRVHAIRAFRDFLYEVHVQNHYPSVTIGDTQGFYLYGDGSTPRTEADGQAWRRVEYQFSQCDAPINVFTKLDIAQEKQLFHDLNNLGKPVDFGLAFEFDESNPVNLWIKQNLIPKILGGPVMVGNRDQKNWDVDEGKYLRKDLAAVNAFLFLRKTSVKNADPRHVTPATTAVAAEFWTAITKVKGMGSPGAKKAVVLAQPVVQKALAKLVHEFGIHKSKGASAATTEEKHAALKAVLTGIGTIDWRHSNRLWRAWLLTKPESEFPGITPYLPKDRAKAAGEFATIDNNRVRFGVKHNEIASALENLLRYELKLPRKKGRWSVEARDRRPSERGRIRPCRGRPTPPLAQQSRNGRTYVSSDNRKPAGKLPIRHVPNSDTVVAATLRTMVRLARRYKRDPAIVQLARELVSNVKQPGCLGDIKALHAFVRDDIRFTSESAGIDVVRAPTVVLEMRAGDCIDKPALLATLLQAIGKPA